jgi:hypothetical protein
MRLVFILSTILVFCSHEAFADNFRCPSGRVRYVEVEEWTYNEGPNTLVHYLKFRDGILTEVKTGTFGR